MRGGVGEGKEGGGKKGGEKKEGGLRLPSSPCGRNFGCVWKKSLWISGDKERKKVEGRLS